MLGWAGSASVDVDTVSDEVMNAATAWVKNQVGHKIARFFVPKQGECYQLMDLYDAIREKLARSQGFPRLIREVDLGDRWLRYARASK